MLAAMDSSFGLLWPFDQHSIANKQAQVPTGDKIRFRTI